MEKEDVSIKGIDNNEVCEKKLLELFDTDPVKIEEDIFISSNQLFVGEPNLNLRHS